MSDILTIIFGAGASANCRPEYRKNPLISQVPITNELFNISSKLPSNEARAREDIFRKYRGADVIGYNFESTIKTDSLLTLEDYLCSVSKRPSPNSLRNLREIPFCLRELIGNAGNDVINRYRVTDYDRLIDHIDNLGYKRILIITLNYDLLIDNALGNVCQFSPTEMNSYLNFKNKWFLIKLHGSVDWIKRPSYSTLREIAGKKLAELDLLTAVDPKEKYLADLRIECGHKNFHYRGASPEDIHYPVMVLPLGQEKKHICPDDHIEAMQKLLLESGDLWIIGNSMRDEDLLSFLTPAFPNFKKILIVDKPQDESDFRTRFNSVLKRNDYDCYLNGFNFFTQALKS